MLRSGRSYGNKGRAHFASALLGAGRALCVVLCLLLAVSSLSADRAKASKEATEQAVREYLSQHPEVVGEIVHQYLADHPELVMEAMRRYQVREEKKKAQLASEAIATSGMDLYNDPVTPAAGASGHAVQVVEFFDYRCPFCRRVDPVIWKLLDENRNLRVVFKELPILGDESVLAAKASLASYRQGAYLKFHEALMSQSGHLTSETVTGIAGQLGLDLQKFNEDMKSAEISATIESNRKLAESLQIEATPSFVIGGELVPGALNADDLRAKIAKAQAQP
jgi:protein-disulfide isomerase